MRPTWPTEAINQQASKAAKADKADKPMRSMRPMSQWLDKANKSMRLIWPNEAVAANVSDSVDVSNAAWIDMADAKESNNGKFDYSQMTA